jgi:hypothetical protein
MEAIEESQVNDRSIMEATVIERQDSSGRIRFKTKLPSGRELESNWIQESDKTTAGIQWAEAVRGQIVADSSQAATRARRNLQETRAKAPARLVDSSGQALSSSVPAIPTMETSARPSVSSVQSPTSSALDPSAYVRVQYDTAHRRAEELAAQLQQLKFELEQVQKAESQWFGILTAMGVNVRQNSEISANSNRNSGSPNFELRISTDPRDAIADQDDSDPDTIS